MHSLDVLNLKLACPFMRLTPLLAGFGPILQMKVPGPLIRGSVRATGPISCFV